MRILIVEDDDLFAEILQTFVEANKCTPIVVNTLEAAKQQLTSSVFQFVLLDNRLPDGDGLHFIQTIKEMSPIPLPVMMITADDNQNVISEAFNLGADDFLIKPLSLDLLWHKLQRVHSLYQKEAKLEEQAKSLETLLNNQEREEHLARYVYEHVSANLVTQTECVDTYLQSSSVFNGDVFICDTAPNGNRFVILADATGHGLSAAICILPLVTTIKAMIRKGLSLPHIVHEANKKLCRELPDDKFVTLIGVEVNFHKRTLLIFNGGMPDIIAVQHDNNLKRYPSTSMALGIMEPEDFDPGIINIAADPIRNLFFFSDGLIEQNNSLGEAFGMHRVMSILAERTPKEPLLSQIINHFTVFNELIELQDDLSICDLQVEALLDTQLLAHKNSKQNKSGKIIASITLEGNLIAATDIVGAFDGLMQSVDVVGDLRQKAFTVFAELISNSLDHGILELDSSLKNDIAGFAEYIELKEARLSTLHDAASLAMTLEFTPKTQEMVFTIQDSGKGYDSMVSKEMKESALSGRGMALINKLCTQVDVKPPGNCTTIKLKRES